MIKLKYELMANLKQGGVDAVKDALQQAIELEHSTIPLYLYALYSLDPKINGEIAAIIKSVVIEEMLHLTLAANVLNALGGSPVLDAPGFIPTYPGPLPGGVEDQLQQVQLAPFSFEQLNVFLTIEEPEKPIIIPEALFAAAATPVTIGSYYRRIMTEIQNIDDSEFAQAPRNQIGPDAIDGSIVVVDKTSAIKALEIIIDQGEGTPQTPLEMGSDEPAHFYRFQQILKKKKLIPAPGKTPPWVFGGAPISLDPKGVYNVPINPSRQNYTGAQLFACDTFNYTYTNLLKSLHTALNGSPSELDNAIGLMMALKTQAKAMMSGYPDPNVVTGPTFEYQPTNPKIIGS
jgi:rubrerythrin